MPELRVAILDDHITPYRIPFFQTLANLNLDLTVIYCAKRLRERRWELTDKIAFKHIILPNLVIRLPKSEYPNELRSIIINPTLPFYLMKLNPDIVVGYAFSLPAWIAFGYAMIFRKKYISWSTDTLHTERNLSWLQRLSRRIIIPRAHAALTPSDKGRDKFLAYGADPASIFTIPQSPPSNYAEQTGPSSGDALFPLSSEAEKVILFVGFLSALKGVNLLIDAFIQLNHRLPETRLLLVGYGHLEESLKAQCQQRGLQDKVIFAGFRPPEDLPAIYRRADLFVFPTLGDTYGAALGEAAMCGLPIVCSTYAGAADVYVDNGVNGFIVDPANTDELCNAMLDILSNGKQIQMGARSREIALSRSLKSTKRFFEDALQFAMAR